MSNKSTQPANFSDRNPPPSNRQLLILLGLFLGFIFGVIWLVGLLLNNLVWFIPPSVEQRIGAIVAPAYERIAKPSPTQETLNELLNKLETNLPQEQRQERNYQILYVPENTVNALALPGDRIIIYAGLLNQMESENELMMVLGHELGHFANRDHLRGILRQLALPIALSIVFGDTSSLQSYAINIANSISNAQFSQAQETAADEFGLQLLQRTYGHVAGATDFFNRLSKQKNIDFAFLSTHPAPSKRVKEIQQLIKEKNYPVKERSALPEMLKDIPL